MSIARTTYGVGYASGVFDMFHVGHLNLLRRARHRCRHLVVGVASDEYVEILKGRQPVVPCDERIDIISALGIVDEVVIDRSEDKRMVWEQRPFDVIFKGDDNPPAIADLFARTRYCTRFLPPTPPYRHLSAPLWISKDFAGGFRASQDSVPE